MAALSAVVFALSWWLGLYLLARDPRKPILVWTAVGSCSFAVVVALDAVRLAGGAPEGVISQVEAYLSVLPGVAWLTVLLEMARPVDTARSRWGALVVGAVAVVALVGAELSAGVHPPLLTGHWVMFGAISSSSLVALVLAVRRLRLGMSSRKIVPPVVAATLFFGLLNAILLIPLGLLPSWIVLASAAFDVLLLGIAVAWWDAFDEGQALRRGMRRSLVGSMAVALLFGGQVLIGLAVTGRHLALVVLLFTSLGAAIANNVLADPLAGALDRLAFSRSPELRADRAALRQTEAALPLRATHPLQDIDDETFVRLTRRALGHYGDLPKLVASPLTALSVIDQRLALRGAPDRPLERANELKALLADRIDALKPRDGADFGTTEQWRHYNSLYFPYVVGVRAYAQNATAAGLDPVARQAWQWFVTEVPQRSLHNWQNAAAKVIAADLRGTSVATL